MPFAIIGVRRNVGEDTADAIHCLQSGFASLAEALEHAHAIWQASRQQYSEMYPDTYAGEVWIPKGGRCYLYAYRVLTEEYDGLIASGYYGDSPVLVHGYCRRFTMVDGKPVPSGHAWIEGNDRVLDCGSYIPKMTPYDKEEYYRQKGVVAAYRYTRARAEQYFKAEERPYPWQAPPEEFARERAIWDQSQQ